MENTTLNRRAFMQISSAAGGAFVLGFSWLRGAAAETLPVETAQELNAFIKIAKDNTITLMSPNPEVGQGIKTAFPMIVAEELDADWSKIIVEQAPLDTTKFQRQVAGGSGSTPHSWDILRQAGATVRQVMIQTAAKEWKVDEKQCQTENSHVLHPASGKKISYGELVEKASQTELPSEVTLKDPKDFKIIGTRIPNVDNPKIVTGEMDYGIDTKREGMLYAMVMRPPAFGKKLKSYDDTAALASAGVKKVLKFGDKIGVLADSTWAAKKGRDALKAEWEDGDKLETTDNMFKTFVENLQNGKTKTLRKDGTIEATFEKANQVLEATFEVPFLPHAPMEPMNFFAHVKDGEVELYGPTQTPARARKVVAKMLDIPEEKVSVMMTRMGGGFGRRLAADFVEEAAMLSNLAKAPVQVIWTREDDMQGGNYRPAGLYTYRAALDDLKNLAAWHMKATAINTGNATREDSFPAGALPNFRVDYFNQKSAVTTYAWRAPHHNVIAVTGGIFMDEIAEALGKDPIQFQLALLKQAKSNPIGKQIYDVDRYRTVIETVAEKANWGKKMPEGIFRGFAAHYSHRSYVAQIADVSVENGEIKVHKVVCAVDCGILVNKSGGETEIEGGMIDGLGHAMYGELTLNNGEIDQKNYNTYKMIRIKDAPEMEVYFVDNGIRPTGLGEPGLPPIGAAVANAVYQATGKRMRKLPFTKESLDSQ